MEFCVFETFCPVGESILGFHSQLPHPKHCKSARYTLLPSPGPKVVDEELYILEKTCVWSVGEIVKQSYTLETNEILLHALFAHLESRHRTLVLIFESFAKFYLDDGRIFVSNLPFIVNQVWALDHGLLLTRKLEYGEHADSQIPFVFTWTHPLEEIKWIPTAYPSLRNQKTGTPGGLAGSSSVSSPCLAVDQEILAVNSCPRSNATLIISLDPFSGKLSVWEYTHVNTSTKGLERNFSIYRSSPVNFLGESQMAVDLSIALGDTKSCLGMRLLGSCIVSQRYVWCLQNIHAPLVKSRAPLLPFTKLVGIYGSKDPQV